MKKFGRVLMYIPVFWFVFWVFFNFFFSPPFQNIDVNPFMFLYLAVLILINPITIVLVVIGLIGWLIQRERSNGVGQ